ncbi:MAG: hypothetical protein ACLFTT_00245 [Candidatus Hydrogenedentota bacterium]
MLPISSCRLVLSVVAVAGMLLLGVPGAFGGAAPPAYRFDQHLDEAQIAGPAIAQEEIMPEVLFPREGGASWYAASGDVQPVFSSADLSFSLEGSDVIRGDFEPYVVVSEGDTMLLTLAVEGVNQAELSLCLASQPCHGQDMGETWHVPLSITQHGPVL